MKPISYKWFPFIELSDKATVTAEEFYDVPVCFTEDRLLVNENRVICWSNKAKGVHIKMVDQRGNLPNKPECYKSNSSLNQLKKNSQQNSKSDDAPSVARRSIFMEELLHDGDSSIGSHQTNPDVDENTADSPVYDTFVPVKDEQLQNAIYNNVVSSETEESPQGQDTISIHQVSNTAYVEMDIPDDVIEWQKNNDSDGISLRSAISEYSSNCPNSKWNIPAAEAKMQVSCTFIQQQQQRHKLNAFEI